MCQCSLVSEAAATSSDHKHFSPYHFCHSMSRSGFPIIFWGFQQLRLLQRTFKCSYWVQEVRVPLWEAQLLSSKRLSGSREQQWVRWQKPRQARGKRILTEERVTDSVLLTQMSGGDEGHWLFLPLSQVRSRTLGKWCTAFTKDANLHEAS